MVCCPTCNQEMALVTYPKMQVFQCNPCGLLIELSANKDGAFDYNKVIVTEIPKSNLSDITMVELEKQKSNMKLSDEMNLILSLDSTRYLEILAKHIKRDIASIKIDTETLELVIPNYELPRVFTPELFPEEITKRILKYFRTTAFFNKYLPRMDTYFKYATLTEEGRMRFVLPNEQITAELQRFFILTKIFFIHEASNTCYLPWNSILLLKNFVDLPRELNEQIQEFITQKWLPSNSFHKNFSFETELRGKLTKSSNKPVESIDNQKREQKKKPETKSKSIMEYL